MRRRARWALRGSAAAVFAGAVALLPLPGFAAAPTRVSRRDRAFDELSADWLTKRLEFRPDEATEAGRHDVDDRLPDFSALRVRRRVEELTQQSRVLREYESSPLPLEQAVELAAVEGRVRSELRDLDAKRTWKTDAPLYPDVADRAIGGLIRLEFAPENLRLRALVRRLDALPAFYATAQTNLSQPSRAATQVAIEAADRNVEFLDGLVALWGRQAAGQDAALREDFLRAQTKALGAARDFRAWLEKELLPRSNGSYTTGPGELAERLEDEEHIEIPPLELLKRAEAQLALDRRALAKTAAVQGLTPAEALRKLSDRHPSAERLTVDVVGALENARSFLRTKKLVTVPGEGGPSVRTMPPFLRASGLVALELPGPDETSAVRAYYDVAPILKMWDDETREEHLRQFDPASTLVRALRDVWPGRYLRWRDRSRLRSPIRARALSSANAEGWPYYADQMAVDQGIAGGDPRVRLAQLSDAISMDCGAVVALKLHAAGVRLEEAADVFVSAGLLERDEAEEEARLQAYRPTALDALVGKLLIQDLRKDYLKARRGSLGDFHDAFLAQGYLPIPLVRRALRLP